ncbi:hypothetical protein Golob_026072, partial [Gossypium lobatum]|nr:hypothetical protein [Gossypium lobatum]
MNIYDLVITSVNMPDMDAFKLLELVGLEMGLLVISRLEVFENGLPYFLILDEILVLSVHGNTKLVKKGITHGTCDYLFKLVRIVELENIWQHVKYRLYLGLNDVVALGNKDSCYLRMGGMFGRLKSSTAFSLHGISSSVIQPGHSQTSNNLINGSRKIQPAM